MSSEKTKSEYKGNDAIQVKSKDGRSSHMPIAHAVRWVRGSILAEILLVMAIVALASALRFASLGAKSLWFDEVRSYYDARDAFWLVNRAHLWAFKAMNLALRLGRDWDFLLRLPSAIAGVLSVLFVYLAARVAFGRRTAVVSSLLAAISVYNVWFSQEARYYGIMMFLAACSLYFIVLLFEKRFLWSVVALGVLGYACYRVHPTTLVFVSAEMTFIVLWFAFDRGARERLVRPIRTAYRQRRIVAFVVGAVILLIFLFGFYRFAGKRMWQTLVGVLRGEIVIGETVAPEVGVSWKFLYWHLVQFGTKGMCLDGLCRAAIYLSGLSFFAGVAILFFKKRALGLFLLYVPATTTLALLTFQTRQTYAVKYVSFLFPLYVFGIGYFISEAPFLIFRWSRITRSGGQFVPWIIMLALAAPIVIANVRSLWKYYGGERMNYKGAVLEFVRQSKDAEVLGAYGRRYNATRVKADIEPGKAVLAGYGLSHYSAEYYFENFELPAGNLVELPEMRGTGIGAIHRLRELCAEDRAVYFVTGWDADQPGELLEWVRERFDLHKEFPRLPAMYCSTVELYRCRYPARYVAYPHSYRAWFDGNGRLYQPRDYGGGEKQREESGAMIPRSGLKKTLFFDTASSYVISVKVASENRKGNEVEFLLDGRRVGLARIEAGAGVGGGAFAVSVPSGAHEVAFLGRADAESDPGAVRILEMRIEPDFSQEVRFEAEDFSYAQPTYQNSTGGFRGREAFVMPLNSYVGYEITLPENGTYVLGIEANNDKPGPVIIELTLDDNPMGFLLLSEENNAWGKKSFPFVASAGKHKLTFSFVSHFRRRGQEGDDAINVCGVDFFTIRRVVSRPSILPDERFAFKNYIWQLPQKDFYPFELPAPPGSVHTRWYFGKGQCPVFLDGKEGVGTAKSLRMEIPYDAEAVVMAVNLNEVPPGKILYFSVRVKTKDLDNHSASAIVQYFGKNDKPIKVDWATQEGFTGTNDWQRQVYFKLPSKDVAHAAICLAVYRNSNMVSKRTGYVWFDDLRMEQVPK